jgi:hypothetical protein
MQTRPTHSIRLAGVFFLAAAATACGNNEYASPPPPAVTTQHPIIQDVTRFAEYTGTAEAPEVPQGP